MHGVKDYHHINANWQTGTFKVWGLKQCMFQIQLSDTAEAVYQAQLYDHFGFLCDFYDHMIFF